LLALAVASALAACKPGFLGEEIDRPPPLSEMRTGGPSGLLLQGPTPPYVPPAMADAVIGSELRQWLTPAERQSLAEASQGAAIAPTATEVPWRALDGAGAQSAAGTVMPVRDAYRSVHGRICRDVRQSVARGEEPKRQQVTLCREDQGSGLYVWRIDKAD
jgi:surface antigen